MSALNFPTGTVVPHAAPIIPNGWVKCDGGAYDGTTDQYKALWTVLGLTYGGSNQASFRVPNLGGRVPVGVKSTTTGTGLDGPVGSWCGATATTLTSGRTGIRNHRHPVSDPGHSHPISHTQNSHSHGNVVYAVINYETKNANRDMYNADSGNPRTYSTSASGVSVSLNGNTLSGLSLANNAASDASASHTNIQPQLVLNYIIKL